MAETLKSFLVSIGFMVDTASQAKAEEGVAKTERKNTAIAKAEADKRTKLDTQTVSKRQGLLDVEAKKVRDRNRVIFTEQAKHVEQLTGLVTGLAKAAGVVGGAFAGSAFFNSVVNTAGSFSRLQLDKQRTGASAQHIQAVVYALGQMGVDEGQAQSSFGSFSAYLKNNPGAKSLLKNYGVDTSGDDAEIFGRLGTYFSKLPRSVANAAAGRMGVSTDSMLSLERQTEFQSKLKEFQGTQFGLDPDEAAKQGREFSAAYDKLATDLGGIRTKAEAQFFTPMTAAMRVLSEAIEGNPKAVDDMKVGLIALGDAMEEKVLPRFATLLTSISGLNASDWLSVLLAPGAAAALVKGGSGGSTAAGGAGAGAAAGPIASSGGVGGWWKKHAPTWAGGRKTGAARAALGRQLGTDTGGASSSTLTDAQRSELAAGIHRTAAELGIDPADVATAISYETAGTMNPWKRGPTTKWGVHRGLIQWGEPQRAQYGVTQDSSITDQMVAVTKYLKAAGVQPGMGIEDIYSAINAGKVGKYGASDGYGTVASHTAKMMAAARDRNALALLEVKHPSAGPFGGLNRDAFRPGTFGGLDKDAFKAAPLGVSPSLYSSYDQSRGDSTFSQTNTFNVTGGNPVAVADAVKATARRGGKDYVRNLQGASQ